MNKRQITTVSIYRALRSDLDLRRIRSADEVYKYFSIHF